MIAPANPHFYFCYVFLSVLAVYLFSWTPLLSFLGSTCCGSRWSANNDCPCLFTVLRDAADSLAWSSEVCKHMSKDTIGYGEGPRRSGAARFSLRAPEVETRVFADVQPATSASCSRRQRRRLLEPVDAAKRWRALGQPLSAAQAVPSLLVMTKVLNTSYVLAGIMLCNERERQTDRESPRRKLHRFNTKHSLCMNLRN